VLYKPRLATFTPWGSFSEGEPPKQATNQPIPESLATGSLEVLRKTVKSVSFKAQTCVQYAGAEGSAQAVKWTQNCINTAFRFVRTTIEQHAFAYSDAV
jgi:hypothetical protein